MENDDTFDFKAEMESGVVICETRNGGYSATCEGVEIGRSAHLDSVLEMITKYQNKTRYWPYIFSVNDHGNVSQIVIIQDNFGGFGYEEIRSCV
jgi:hypothetical protein